MELDAPVPVVYTVYVLKTKKHGYRTRPSRIVVEEGDAVVWRNMLHRPVKILFGADNPFALNSAVEIRGGEQSDALKVERGRKGKHPYTVETVEPDGGEGQYADGDSDPVIDVL
jgi:hypothetical protein